MKPRKERVIICRRCSRMRVYRGYLLCNDCILEVAQLWPPGEATLPGGWEMGPV